MDGGAGVVAVVVCGMPIRDGQDQISSSETRRKMGAEMNLFIYLLHVLFF